MVCGMVNCEVVGVDVDDPSYFCSLDLDQTRLWVGSRQTYCMQADG